VQERFSFRLSQAQDFHTVPEFFIADHIPSFLIVRLYHRRDKIPVAILSKEKDGVTDVSSIREPEEL
jgi:hypothetical protein